MKPVPGLADSGLLHALLRALVFAGSIEAITYRLLPAPAVTDLPVRRLTLHESLDQAGQITFILAFILLMASLLTVARRTLRLKPWPLGLNGFLSICFLCLAGLGVSAALPGRGPGFAVVFTSLGVLTVLFMASHGFAHARTSSVRWFIVTYTSVIVCSLIITSAEFLERAGRVTLLVRIVEPALKAGHFLLFLSAITAFLAFVDLDRSSRRHGILVWGAVFVCALAAACFAYGSLMMPTRLSLLDPEVGTVGVLGLSFGLFIGSLTALLNLMDRERRALGFGLALLLLAGFPIRIVQQDLLMVLGMVLILVPRPVRPPVPTIILPPLQTRPLDRPPRYGPGAPRP